MSQYTRSCHSCKYYKTMGGKGFCFKKNTTISRQQQPCSDYKPKVKVDKKKRWILDEKDKRQSSKTHDTVKVTSKPQGSEGFKLDKTQTKKQQLYFDANITEEENSEINQYYGISQNLVYPLLIGIIILILATLKLTGKI
jgi:hypothetical protein